MAEIVRDSLTRKTQAELQQIALKSIKKNLSDTLRENQDSGHIKLIADDSGVVPVVGSIITVQLWYNPLTRNAYLEYDLNEEAQAIYNEWRVKEIFEEKLEQNFHKDTIYMYIQILHPEDGYAEECDSSFLSLPTPYSIGYWKSLTGRYEFLEDRQFVLSCANDILNMSDEITEGLPDKTFEQFCNEVNEIAQRYRQTYLNEDQKNEYITQAYEIANTYDRTSPEYTAAMEALKNQYSIKTNIANQVPQMFAEYKTLFIEWFGDKLYNDPTVQMQRIYYKVYDPQQE